MNRKGGIGADHKTTYISIGKKKNKKKKDAMSR
jgi:hypothetical protein